MGVPASFSQEVSVIDLAQERAVVVQQLFKAFQENGFFQVINHGISENLMDEAMKVYKEFYSLPSEERAKYTKAGAVHPRDGGIVLYKKPTTNFGKEYFRDILRHSCLNVGEEEKKTWPDNPSKYREIIGEYSAELIRLSQTILGLVAEGLGTEADYFVNKQLGALLLGTQYPACTDGATLTLGVGAHCDPNLLTLIQQEVSGLEILKDGKWIGVEPIPHAFVINSGLALTVISNGKLTSVEHRVVTNDTQPRISIGTFISPEEVVEPAKSSDPPLFKPIDWFNDFIPHFLKKKSVSVDTALEIFKVDQRNE